MKTLLFVASLAVALIAMPVVAQQGPAGVPGAPGLAPPPPPPPAVVAAPITAAPATAANCSKAKAGAQGKACPAKKAKPGNCSASSDPARCEQYQKTKKLCQNLPERDYRQCLRDNLTTKK